MAVQPFDFQAALQNLQQPQKPQGILDPMFGLRFAAAAMANSGWSTTPVSDDEVIGKALLTAMNGGGGGSGGSLSPYQMYQIQRDQYEDSYKRSRDEKSDSRSDRRLELEEGGFNIQQKRWQHEQEKLQKEREKREKAKQNIIDSLSQLQGNSLGAPEAARPDLDSDTRLAERKEPLKQSMVAQSPQGILALEEELDPARQEFKRTAMASSGTMMNDAGQEAVPVFNAEMLKEQSREPGQAPKPSMLPAQEVPEQRGVPNEMEPPLIRNSENNQAQNPPKFYNDDEQKAKSIKEYLTEPQLEYLRRKAEYDPVGAEQDMMDLYNEALKREIDLSRSEKDKSTSVAESLRKEFTNSSGEFIKQRDATQRVLAAAEDPSPAGDLALIFNYMKVLDPGSTVREGEFANAQNSGSVPDRVAAMYNSILKGERLSGRQRSDFVNRAARLYQSQAEIHNKLRDQYDGIAESLGLEPSNVIVDYLLSQKDIDQAMANYAPDTYGGEGEKGLNLDAGNRIRQSVGAQIINEKEDKPKRSFIKEMFQRLSD